MEAAEFCEKLSIYIDENPDHCDIKFLVGPQKEIIRTLRAVLEVASPIFVKLFNNVWDDFISNPENDVGIPLPDVEPKAFRIFLKLLLSDGLSEEIMKSLHLEGIVVLNVMELCKRFGLPKLYAKLERFSEKFMFTKLTNFIQSDEFLEESQKNVRFILSRDEISLDEKDIFEIACKWAVYQCNRAGTKNASLENIRTMLGDCIYEIRFPSMAFYEFGKIIRSKNILTVDEQVEIFQFLSIHDTLKECEVERDSDPPKLRFNPRKRSMNFVPNMSFLKYFKAVDDPPFVWDSQECSAYFQTDRRIQLTSLGFLGPIDYDSYYDCHVEVFRYNSNYSVSMCGQDTKRIFALRHKVFYFKLDSSISIEPTITSANSNKSAWNDYYGIRYSMKGPKTQSLEIPEDERKSSLCFASEADGVTFYSQWSTSPFVELQFRKD